MIHVDPQPEPPEFDQRVRRPGRLAVARMPETLPAVWRRCIPHLWKAYGGICAYLCVRIPPGTGARSVDHLLPRSKRPDLAYEWSNFRLACSLMNSRKQNLDQVLDPFMVEDGWFVLELSSLEVLPSPGLKPTLRRKVQATINRLKLNDPECRGAREEHYDPWVAGEMSTARLRRWSPFVAKEIERQGLASGRPSSRRTTPRRPPRTAP